MTCAAILLGVVGQPAAAPAQGAPSHLATLSMPDAVSLALARNRDVVAAQLEVDAAVVDEIAAKLYPNPEFEFSLGNLVLGAGNPQEQNLRPSFFQQNAASYTVRQTLDVWGKRQVRWAAARQHQHTMRLGVADAMREIAYLTRSRFADVLREQDELALMQETRRGYAQTVTLMRRREAAGDIAHADLDKVELESLRYTQLLLLAERELADARGQLAQVLTLSDAAALPETLQAPHLPSGDGQAPDAEDLAGRAMGQRPDLQAARAEHLATLLGLDAARRERFSDLSVGVGYTRSHFQISGDNPHALGVQLGFSLPLFERNQAGMAEARVRLRRADNVSAQLAHTIRHEVASASRAWRMASQALHIFEEGGMLERALRAREVAKRSFAAGATSLLELLEAERTYLETRADYLRMQGSWRQAHIDVAHATGGEPP